MVSSFGPYSCFAFMLCIHFKKSFLLHKIGFISVEMENIWSPGMAAMATNVGILFSKIGCDVLYALSDVGHGLTVDEMLSSKASTTVYLGSIFAQIRTHARPRSPSEVSWQDETGWESSRFQLFSGNDGQERRPIYLKKREVNVNVTVASSLTSSAS
jgi:hypothetical protein